MAFFVDGSLFAARPQAPLHTKRDLLGFILPRLRGKCIPDEGQRKKFGGNLRLAANEMDLILVDAVVNYPDRLLEYAG